jgi:hypothetical protein
MSARKTWFQLFGEQKVSSDLIASTLSTYPSVRGQPHVLSGDAFSSKPRPMDTRGAVAAGQTGFTGISMGSGVGRRLSLSARKY